MAPCRCASIAPGGGGVGVVTPRACARAAASSKREGPSTTTIMCVLQADGVMHFAAIGLTQAGRWQASAGWQAHSRSSLQQ
jgi:hypothetical protein